jgi:hypothetical protein
MLIIPTPVRFLISCVDGRVGSYMLCSMLDAHSKIRCWGEIYNPNHPQVTPYGQAEQSMEFLKKNIYTHQVSGFKLIAYQIDALDKAFAAELLSQSRMIFLKRDNYLDRYLSKLLSQKYNYHAKYGDEPVTMNVGKLSRYIVECQAREKNRLAEFRRTTKGVIETTYERLLHDRETAMKELFDFLEVPYESVEPKTRQQRTKTQREMLSNYDEVRDYLKDGPNAHFLT